MRRVPALFAAAGLVLVSLAGCSADPGTNCDTDLKPGTASDLVNVSGRFGAAPSVSFPTPVKASTSQRSVVLNGNGPLVHTGQEVVIDYSVYDGSSGLKLQASEYNGSWYPLTIGQSLPGLDKGLQCATVGSRVALVVAPKDAKGVSLGNSPTDSLIFVVDIHKAYPAAADGVPVPAQPGFPTVVLAPGGRPGINAPSGTPPTSLMTETLKQGSGKKVSKNDLAVLHYTGVTWDSRTPFDSTWGNGGPSVVSMASGQTNANGQLPTGVIESVIGKRVGSQVVVLVPPAKGFGAQGTSTVGPNETLIYVVDILGTK